MNWKENPHLFANGTFQVKHEQLGLRYITGHDFENRIFWCGWLGLAVSECTLIARHIDDMTDEEWETSNLMRKRSKEMRLKWLKTVVLSAEDMLYLLSIGVYPFKWPTDGSVVDMNTLKEEEWVGS